MNAETVEGVTTGELLVGLWLKVVRVAALAVGALETNEVVWIVFTDQGGLDDGVESLDHVFPDRCTASGVELSGGVLQGGRRSVRLGCNVVCFKHGELVVWNSKGGPEELLLGDNEVGEQAGHDDGPDLLSPDLALLVQGLGFDEGFDLRAESETVGKKTQDSNSVARTAGFVETF